jgi:hypothetical protein
MPAKNWDFPLEPAPNPWKRERRVTMSISYLLITLFLTFLLGWVVGQMTPTVDHTDQRPTTTITEDDPRWDCTTMGNQVCGPKATEAQDIANSQAYADWCGGYVQTTKDERVVVGCVR